MTPVRISILTAALFAGLASVGLLAHGMAAGKPRPVVIAPASMPVEKPMTRVLVAARDLQVGDRLTIADMKWQAFPRDAVIATYITDGAAPVTPQTSQAKVQATLANAAGVTKTVIVGPTAEGASAGLVDAIVREAIGAGEPILMRKVVHAGDAGIMAVSLEPGKRAIAVPLSAESAAGGFILPGDHVDIVQSRPVDTGGAGGPKRVATSTVMTNVRVLAIDQNTKPQKAANTAVGATATVEVDAGQAETLIMAKAQGDLTLALRSYAEAAGGPRLGPGASAGPVGVVRVFRNGVPSDVKVAR